MQSLRPLLHSIFHPPVSTLEASVSSAITSIGYPGSRDYRSKINDWLTATGLPVKSNKCNLQAVLNNIQNIMNGISINKPGSVLPLDISKAIQERLHSYGILQKDAVFDAKDMKYSWVITGKKENICMSIKLPTDKTHYGLYGSKFGYENINETLSEINVFLTQITSFCNLMDNTLINPDHVVLSDGLIISSNEFINQAQVNIKNKMEGLERIKQDYIRLFKVKEKEVSSTKGVYESLGLIQEKSFLEDTNRKIEEEYILLSDDINNLYCKVQQCGFEIRKESFFPQATISEFLRKERSIFSFTGISNEELLQQIEGIGSVIK